MSSYIVDKETIDKIVTTCRQIDELRQMVKEGFSGPETGLDLTVCEDATQFGRALLHLNNWATAYRYPDHEFDDVLSAAYTFTSHSCNIVEGYKAARCWLYQCDEGDFDKHHTYRMMEKIMREWAQEIVEGLTEYEAAPWG